MPTFVPPAVAGAGKSWLDVTGVQSVRREGQSGALTPGVAQTPGGFGHLLFPHISCEVSVIGRLAPTAFEQKGSL